MIIIRAKIGTKKIGNEVTVERSNKAKSWFFEKTNKINFCNDLSVKNRKEEIDK